jgi:uncharacterized protein (DUF58 family)
VTATAGPEAILQRVEWTVLRRLDGLLHGDYRTLFRGYGMDIADLREYQYGDDVRHIDWNVTARLQSPYVREFHEDREITAWFLLDLSQSVNFGSTLVRKRNVSSDFVAMLARLLTRRGNRVGALYYGERVDGMIPPRSGRRQVLNILHAMQAEQETPSSSGTNLAELLRAAEHVVRRRSLIFVVSDFISAPGWGESLGRLAQRNEIIAVRLHDPLEAELPDLGLVVVQDAETGEQLYVDTNDKRFRKRFAEAARRRETELRATFREAAVDAIELSTNDDLVDTVLRFAELKRRGRHSARKGMRHELSVA